MIKFENTEVMNFEGALRGMRNPLNSWDKSDSKKCECSCVECLYPCLRSNDCNISFVIGENDLALAQKLIKAGSDHRKFMRQIFVSVDITAPLYWWKEYDTYKVGTVSNSCSTMHKLMSKELTLDDFSHEHLVDNLSGTYCPENWGETSADYIVWPLMRLRSLIRDFNAIRDGYLAITDEIKTLQGVEHSDYRMRLYQRLADQKSYWWQIIQMLPSSYNQRRTIKMNYEVLANIYEYRRNHKLDEWRTFCEWIEKLPHSEVITGKWEEK